MCGCKNKGNQTTPPPQPQQVSQVDGVKTNNQSIQESIKKVVEKYYKKK